MNEKKLGFGLMRLPVNSEDPTDINQDELNEMVDLFLDRGFTYFDTSYVYHNGESERAIKRALVERHDRNTYTLASKFPTFIMPKPEQVEGIFQEQLDKCGVDYFDYYLLHNLNRTLYVDEVEKYHLFDYMKKWKEEGKIKHLGFSYHDDAKHLDKILNDHPEVEFVQIIINYYDWDEPFIQAKACYDVIRKHGCDVIVMEPVKGGMLAKVPETALNKMKELDTSASASSYAVRFAAGHEGILTVLSGMSTLEQVKDNTSYMTDFKPLNKEELEVLDYTKKEIMKTWKYSCEEINAPVSSILRAYNSILIQPNPFFAAELNYYKTFKLGYNEDFEKTDYSAFNEKAGYDVNNAIKEAIDFQTEHSF